MKWLLFFFLPLGLYAYPQPNSLYNQGLEAYQRGEKGQAAYALKQALSLQPAHGEARSLYNRIQNEIGGLPVSDSPVYLFFLGIATLFSPLGDFLLSALFFLGASTLVVIKLLSKGGGKLTLWMGITFGVSAALAVQGVVKAQVFRRDVRIAVTPVDLTDEISEGSRILGSFSAGLEFSVLDKEGGFLLVQSHTGIKGWASKDAFPLLWEEDKK